MDLDYIIRKVPDFPKPGVLFYDLTSVFLNPAAFEYVVDEMCKKYDRDSIDGVIAIESRGFLLGAPFALKKAIPLVLARKKGKLPGETIQENYSLEYGEATLEIQKDDLISGKRWLIIDDLIATGGTIEAVAKMVERQGSSIEGIFSIVGLPFLNYKERIGKYNPFTLINYNNE